MAWTRRGMLTSQRRKMPVDMVEIGGADGSFRRGERKREVRERENGVKKMKY